MGDEDSGDLHFLLDAADLLPGLHPQFGVQVGKGFVQQQHLGPLDQGAGNGHTLLLPAGKGFGFAVQQTFQMDHLGHLFRPVPGFGLGDLAVDQREHNVFQHGHVGVQGVVLEHKPDLPVLRGDGGHVVIPEQDAAPAGFGQARKHEQRGGFSAAGRPQKAHQFPILNFQIQVVHRLEISVLFRQMLDGYFHSGFPLGHCLPLYLFDDFVLGAKSMLSLSFLFFPPCPGKALVKPCCLPKRFMYENRKIHPVFVK